MWRLHAQNKISRAEFLEVCIENLWDYDYELLEMAVANFKTAQTLVNEAPKRYWREVVNEIDKASRFWLPIVYTVSVVGLTPSPTSFLAVPLPSVASAHSSDARLSPWEDLPHGDV